MSVDDASSTASHLYVASLDGTIAPWQVHADLASDDHLEIVGLASIGDALYVAYAAQHAGEAAARLHIARNQAGAIHRFALGADTPDRVVAALSADGRWVWTASTVAGVSDGLQLMALSAPTATPLRMSGVPIASGQVELPSATR
jgi:hypothetical protein